jgi:hypothetical protein
VADGTSALQVSALIFFTACLVTAARWRRNVRLALQIAIDDIIRDRYTSSVLEGLQVTADAVVGGPHGAIVVVEE